jgi:hypothetical protein
MAPQTDPNNPGRESRESSLPAIKKEENKNNSEENSDRSSAFVRGLEV